ncbi:MAG: BlaI/MecI/CopY family transcriptional regulator [Bacteroidales bacterium]|nr:BlaI/MecI/CopY family transcriptional regulator [Bacteroidales bacterium]
MEALTKREEEIMQIFWDMKKGFVKDVITKLPENPPYNTISSIVRILEKKGFLKYKQYGNTYEYSAKISKKRYRKQIFTSLMADYFDNSYKKVVSYMVKENKLDEKDIEEMMKIIEENENK